MARDIDFVKQRQESNFTSGLFWGLLLGAAGMFFFATKKGNKLKKFLSEHGQSFLDEMEEFYDEFESRTISSNKPEAVQEKTKPAKKNAGRVRKIVDENVKDMTHIAKLQERGRKATRKFFSRKGKKLK